MKTSKRSVRENESPGVITIDGPAGAGKSTAARLIALKLGFMLLDSGALYRAVALHLLRNNVLPDNNTSLDAPLKTLDIHIIPGIASMRIRLGAEEVTPLLRQETIGNAASRFAVRPEVRKALLELQRAAAQHWGIVAEGRDMGSVVFPEARVKFFLVADLKERARRRYLELMGRGLACDLEAVTTEMLARDERDQARTEAPLVKPLDALEIDSTNLSQEEVVSLMMEHITRRMHIPGLR